MWIPACSRDGVLMEAFKGAAGCLVGLDVPKRGLSQDLQAWISSHKKVSQLGRPWLSSKAVDKDGLNTGLFQSESPLQHTQTHFQWVKGKINTHTLVHIQVEAGFMCYWIFYLLFQNVCVCTVWTGAAAVSLCGQVCLAGVDSNKEQGYIPPPPCHLVKHPCVCEGERESYHTIKHNISIWRSVCHTHTHGHTVTLSLSVVSVCSALCSAPSWVQPLCGLTVEGVFTPFTQHTDLRVHTYDAARATFHQSFHRWKWQKLSSKVTPFSF